MKSTKNSQSKHHEKIKRIENKLRKFDRCTANEVISMLYNDDVKKYGAEFLITNRGPHYYTHLNKLFSQMEAACIIEYTGLNVIGPTNREEKLWRIVG